MRGWLLITGTTALAKEWLISKAYVREDGSLAVEGWISTPMRDLEKDIMEPESFSGAALYDYMQKGAPISTEHDTNGYPVGYLQKATLVREGKVLQEENNPIQPGANYRYFDPAMIGWYGLGTIDDEVAAKNILKGKVRSFSWIGMPRLFDKLPDGGRRFSQRGAINPLLEVTVTAYPINTAAVMRIAKSYGYPTEEPMYTISTKALVDALVEIQGTSIIRRKVAERFTADK
jgi:hypothetical protein